MSIDMSNTKNAVIYLRRLLRHYRFNEEETKNIVRKVKDIFPLIKEWAKPYRIRIHPSGSFSKKTNIKGNTDIDLLVSLPSQIDITLSDMYNSLFDYLDDKGLKVRKQNVSIGVTYEGLKIDVVPAKRQLNSTYTNSIYKSKSNTWMKTNIQKHILHIQASGRRPEIQILKLWRNLRRLEFPSLLLELATIKALRGFNSGRLPQNIMRVFEYLSEEFLQDRIIDISNTANVLSDDISYSGKKTICDNAHESFYATSWIHIVW